MKIGEQRLKIFLGLIILLSLALRVYHLDKLPTGIFCDEAATGYNAYTILKTGKDEYSTTFPIFFRSFDNFRPGVPFYFSVPFVGLLGLNELAVRLPSAVIGVLNVIVIYYLGRILFSSAGAGILSALFLAISPWHIHFSRYGAENIYFPFFLSLAILLFLLSVKKKKAKFLVLSFFTFGLTLYTYFPAYFLTPAFLLLISILYKKAVLRMKRGLIKGIVLFLLIAIPLVLGLKTGQTLARFHQVSTPTQGKSTKIIVKQMLITYKDHFLPEFLFEKGDIGYHSHFITRFSVRGMGQLYWFQLPLLMMGLISTFKNKKSLMLILGWFILYPLGSTAAPFTDGGGPFASRSIIGVVPFQIISAIGGVYFISLIPKHSIKLITAALLTLIILLSFRNYLHRYFVEYPLYSSDFWGWQYGPKEIVNYFKEVENQYDELVMSGEFNAPYIFLRFYHPDGCGKCKIGEEKMYNPNKRQLFALPPKSLEGKYRYDTRYTIYYPNGKIAFKIVEIKND
jgi:4-amino-4-deoxy-L-arabinose transferase-like glycosyltransferase